MVFIEFSAFNPNTVTHLSVTLMFEQSEAGSWLPTDFDHAHAHPTMSCDAHANCGPECLWFSDQMIGEVLTHSHSHTMSSPGICCAYCQESCRFIC